MTDARARVEVWMWEKCPHDPLRLRHLCPLCLLAFAAAQVRERDQQWANSIQKIHWPDNPELLELVNLARREGPK